MIEFIQQPDELHLSHQKTNVKVKSNNHIITGVLQEARLQIIDRTNFPALQQIEGHVGGEYYLELLGQRFTIMNEDSGLFHPINLPGHQVYVDYETGPMTRDEFFDYFSEQILLNITLNEQFEIIFPGGKEILFKAKHYGTDFDVLKIGWTGNPEWTLSNYDAGIGAGNDVTPIPITTSNNTRLGIQLLNENEDIDSPIFYRVPILSDNAELDGTATWDISETLQALLHTKKPTFSSDYNAGTPFVRHRNFYKYKIKIYNVLDDNSIVTTVSSFKYCMYGKPSWYQQATWNNNGTSFYNDILAHNKFLTQQPTNKTIGWNIPEWLYFINVYGNSTCNIKIKCYFSDDSETTKTVGSFLAYPFDTYQIDVSPLALQLDGTPTKYEIYVEMYDNETDQTHDTEIRYYTIDYNNYPNEHIFIFRNHYGGGFDTLRSTGMLKVIGKIKRDTIKVSLPDDYTFTDSQFQLIDAEYLAEFELDWGFLLQYGSDIQSWVTYMRQIEMSDLVYEFIDGIILPCQFLTDSFEFWDDDKPIKTHTSKFRRAYIDKGHANDPIVLAPDYSEDFNTDYLT